MTLYSLHHVVSYTTPKQSNVCEAVGTVHIAPHQRRHPTVCQAVGTIPVLTAKLQYQHITFLNRRLSLFLFIQEAGSTTGSVLGPLPLETFLVLLNQPIEILPLVLTQLLVLLR